jgi:hypothetical protein
MKLDDDFKNNTLKHAQLLFATAECVKKPWSLLKDKSSVLSKIAQNLPSWEQKTCMMLNINLDHDWIMGELVKVLITKRHSPLMQAKTHLS